MRQVYNLSFENCRAKCLQQGRSSRLRLLCLYWYDNDSILLPCHSVSIFSINWRFKLLLFVIYNYSSEAIMNKVICVGSSQTKIIACGYLEIIDIQSVTIAYVEDRNQCTEEYMIPVIESIQPPCKRSLKNNQYTDGSEVYRR